MNKSLLDTDIFSEILKGKNASVHARTVAYRQTFDRYTIAAPTVTELVDGFTHAGQTTKLAHLRFVLNAVEVLPHGQHGPLRTHPAVGVWTRSRQLARCPYPVIRF